MIVCQLRNALIPCNNSHIFKEYNSCSAKQEIPACCGIIRDSIMSTRVCSKLLTLPVSLSPGPHECSSRHFIPFNISFNIILPCNLRFFTWSLSLIFRHSNLNLLFSSFVVHTAFPACLTLDLLYGSLPPISLPGP